MPTSEPDRSPRRRAAHVAVVGPATGDASDEASEQQPDTLDAVIDRSRRAWHASTPPPGSTPRPPQLSPSAPGPSPSGPASPPGRAETSADRRECGTASIGHHAEPSLAQPFGGIGDSAVGVAGGPWELSGSLRPFVVHRLREA